MDFHQLRVFQSAARTASFTAAGRELLLSQSTVSLHIKQMEDELGSSLFLRTRQRVSLTEAGRVLLQYADRILAETKNATLALQEFAQLKRGTIRLGVGAATLIYVLPPILAEFHRKYPLLELSITTGTTEVLLERLLANALDFALVMSPSDALSAVETVALSPEELVVVLPASHPLAARAELAPRDLDGLGWISHLRGTAMHVVQERFFQQLGIAPLISLEMENMEAIKSLIASGMGLSLLPRCSVAGPYGHGLVAKKVRAAPLCRELLLAALDWSAQPPSTRRLAGRIVQALGPQEQNAHGRRLIEIANEDHQDYVVPPPRSSS